MAAAEQIKSLIKSFSEGDDSRFYATAMQIAAAEARKGHQALAEELKKIIQDSKKSKINEGALKRLPINSAHKELNDLLEFTRPDDKLKDMVLSVHLKKSIQRILDEQRQIEKLRQHNLFPRKKLLLTGPPGCGKTMTARVISSELSIPLFVIRLDGLISRYMGESIAKLCLVFDTMKEFRAVYLFDEFDSIGTTRNQGNEVGEIKRVLNSFLLQIEKDDSNSLIIAATNMPENLDEALFRRFDDIITYPIPTEEQIFKYYKRELLKSDLIGDNVLLELSKKSIGLNFSDLEKICQDFLKNIIIYGKEKSNLEFLIETINSRKRPF
ncbi:AAA family ATPase [Wenyingzhuangia sp. 2_MG-2023]|uniref:AAA family ATPase n=1 Tax=Wenyingzhuangia sp. 2_MG-2023 TaxID=3062639 RepID=UPI0026E43F96|nr:ATP-binding protein [Wenyingzhuangia sp. 2_MG-2023]MDO6737423.1 ATP-binding protein [Wenyingzhuangia sp. 2_MG-2023]